MNDIYEWRRFEIGERVRVRVTSECARPNHPDSWANDLGVTKGHLPTCHGMTGVIHHIDQRTDHHPYVVTFDPPYPWAEPFSADRFAAIELEPVS